MSELDASPGLFVTGIEMSDALLPKPPGLWSFSSLKEVEACPRRYMLSRASYPDLGRVGGYPKLPSFPALMGEIAHDALEIIVEGLVVAGCESPRTAEAVGVMKRLGGLTAVVDLILVRKIEGLQGNPRLNEEQFRRLSRELADGVADVRVRVQEYLSRARFGPRSASETPPAAGAAKAPSAPGRRRRARLGANTEVTVVSLELRLMGRIDLLDVYEDHAIILDYKTGVEDPSHIEQLHIYALLWDLDREVNPDAVPATQLTAAYANYDLTVPAPEPSKLRELEKSVGERIAVADSLFEIAVPPARPSGEQCGLCQVRQLCNDYWTSREVPSPLDVEIGEWFDYTGVVGPANGISSLWMLDGSGRKELLLRITPTSAAFTQGDSVRILGLRRDMDPDVPSPIAVMTARSEVFVLAKNH